MRIRIFSGTYTVRRRGKQENINGYFVSESTDFTARLNIQPLSANELLALPEGERTVKRIKTFSMTALISADEHSGTPGDLLYYEDKWYECKSCVRYIHSPLKHYEAVFVILADQKKHKPPVREGKSDDDK
jgi:hypothetical protein